MPPWTFRELLLKSVLLPRAHDHRMHRWSSGLCLLKVPSSEIVERGPAAKIQVTLSESPSGWQDAHELHALFDCFPRNRRGLKSRMGMSKMPLLGIPRAVKKASLPTSTACSLLPGGGGVPDGTSRVMRVFVDRSMMLTETLTSLLT